MYNYSITKIYEREVAGQAIASLIRAFAKVCCQNLLQIGKTDQLLTEFFSTVRLMAKKRSDYFYPIFAHLLSNKENIKT